MIYLIVKHLTENGYDIEEDLDEYNPAYIIKFKYEEDYDVNEEKDTKVVAIIEKEMNLVFEDIQGKETEYAE